jgi:hypothetical protein
LTNNSTVSDHLDKILIKSIDKGFTKTPKLQFRKEFKITLNMNYNNNLYMEKIIPQIECKIVKNKLY